MSAPGKPRSCKQPRGMYKQAPNEKNQQSSRFPTTQLLAYGKRNINYSTDQQTVDTVNISQDKHQYCTSSFHACLRRNLQVENESS
jgi:hypothetical protein